MQTNLQRVPQQASGSKATHRGRVARMPGSYVPQAATAEHVHQHCCTASWEVIRHSACTQNGSTATSRRQLLHAGAAVALLSVISGLQPYPAEAAAPATCDLQTSSNGLQWCDIAVGEGAYPLKGAFTKAHYTAKLAASGEQFDSSYQKKQPLIFKVGEREVIEAWDVAILGAEDIPPMREGGKRLIVAPPGPLQKQGTKSLVWVVGLSQAIADAGLELSPEGAPTSPLVFEIELLKKRASRG